MDMVGDVKRSFRVLSVGDGRLDAHARAELQQPTFRVGLFQRLLQLRLIAEEGRFMHTEHPQAIALMIVAADQTRRTPARVRIVRSCVAIDR